MLITLYYETFTFRPPLCKELELYEALNSLSVHLKVSYYPEITDDKMVFFFPFRVPCLRSASILWAAPFLYL